MSSHYYNRKRKKKPNRLLEVFTAIVCVLLVCCAYAGKLDPQQFFLAPFLVLAFMPMLVVTLLMLLAALLWRRWIAVLTVVVAMLASLSTFKVFVALNSSENAPPMPADSAAMLTVMTYNVLAFNYNEPSLSAQPSATMRLILDANPDVVLMQEGSARADGLDQIPSLAPYLNEINAKYPYCYYGTDGLNIMSKYPFTTQPLGKQMHTRSPLGYNRDMTSYLARAYDLVLPTGKQLRLVDFRLQSYHLSFGKNMAIRVSPEAKPSPLKRMRRSFALRGENARSLREAIDRSPANVIVCGDMNDVSTSHVYRIICGDDLKDAWADVGTGYAPTFNRYHLPFRIDQVFYRGDLCALKAQRIKGGSSDHYPLMVTFDIDIDSSTKKTN